MTTPSDLFRREALEFWSRQRGPGGVLRLAAPWVRRLYWTVLTLVAAGLALIFLAPIEQTTSGPALVDPQKRTFVAVLPAEVADVQDGRPLRLELNGPGGRQDVAATARHVEAVEDADAEQVGFTSFPRPPMLVTGDLAPDAVPGPEASSAQLTGRAVAVLGSKPAFSVLLHGFEGASEGGDG